MDGAEVGFDRDEVRSAWLNAQDSRETAATYGYGIDHWFKWCDTNAVDVWKARRREVDRWRQGLHRTRARVTVARYLATVASFYRFAITEAEGESPIENNPVANVKRPKVVKGSSGDGLTVEEARALRLASIDASPRTAALVHLLIGTAMRVSEATNSKVSDLGWEDGQRAITVTRKGGTRDRVVIQPDDWAVIDHYLKTRKPVAGGWLLASTRGQMSRQTAYRLVSELAAKTLDRDVVIGPHDLRHTVLTLAFDAGLPAQEVRGLAGHTSVATTQMYDRNAHSRGRTASKVVGNLWTA